MLFLLRVMKKAAAPPPITTSAPTAMRIQTHTGFEPSPPLTVWESRSVKVTLLPSTLPPSPSVTLPGKVMVWVTSSWLAPAVLSSLPRLTTFSLPSCLICPSLSLMGPEP